MTTDQKMAGEALQPIGVGDEAPDFLLPGTSGPIGLADLRGQVAVLYFYPRDNSPGCTTEACDFRDLFHRQAAASGAGKGLARVVGISTDGLPIHHRFVAKHQLPFPLLTDADGEVARAYGCWKEKKLYGRTFWGIERSTFVLDANGIVRKVWRKVRIPGHVKAVAAFVAALQDPA